MSAPLSTSTRNDISECKLELIREELAVAHNNYWGDLMQRALYKTNDREVSQDLVQTTFLKTMIYLRRGGKIDLMRSFLNHVLNALIIDRYRKNDRHKDVSLDHLIDKGFDPRSNDYLADYQRMTNIFDGKKIISLISQLPDKYQEVVHMRYIKGLSLKEIAWITGQAENTVAVQIHRGLTKLKRLYLNYSTPQYNAS
jgi:RNA polymerase sigma-70 factor, ECF subfamily